MSATMTARIRQADVRLDALSREAIQAAQDRDAFGSLFGTDSPEHRRAAQRVSLLTAQRDEAYSRLVFALAAHEA